MITRATGFAFIYSFAVILVVVTPLVLVCVCIGCCSYKLKHIRGETPSAVVSHQRRMKRYPCYKPEDSLPSHASSLSSHPPASSVLFTDPPPSYDDVA